MLDTYNLKEKYLLVTYSGARGFVLFVCLTGSHFLDLADLELTI